MALEGNDINDSAILDATQQYQDANGRVQFKTTLPSGRVIESEFFPADMKRRAMPTWLDTIRQAIVDDAEEVRAQARRKMEEAKRGSLYPEHILPSAPSATHQSGGDSLTTTGLASQKTSESFMNAAPTSPSTVYPSDLISISPLNFARQARDRAQAELKAVEQQMLGLITQQQQLISAVNQWTAVLSSLTPSAPPATIVPTDDPTGAKRSRGRPRKAKGSGNSIAGPSPILLQSTTEE